MLKEALTGRAGLQARVNGILEMLEPRTGRHGASGDVSCLRHSNS